MSYQKELLAPTYYRRKIRRKCKLYGEEDGYLYAKSYRHLRPQGGVLVCAEGSERLGAVPAGSRLFRGQFTGKRYVYANQTLYEKINGELQEIGEFHGLNTLLEVPEENGSNGLYLLSDSGIYKAQASGIEILYAQGGAACCFHYERIFIAEGNRLAFSAPLDFDTWIEDARACGYVDLPSEQGNPLALLTYKEKIYLFRERGIMQIRALGDSLNFKATNIPFVCAGILPNSIVNCGRDVYFCAESGLYRFNGGYCELVMAGLPFNASAGVRAVRYGGGYLAAVTLEGGERAIFCYTREEGGYLICAPAVELLSEEGIFADENGTLFALTRRGFHGRRRECVFESELSMLGLSVGNKRLQALAVEGEGAFTVTVRSDEGERCSASGRAGERIRLPRAVKGNAFSVKIASRDEGIRLSGITFELYEEVRNGN